MKINKLSTLQQKQLLKNSDWKTFINQFNKVHNNHINSSVPAWPMRRSFSCLRILLTTSWLVMPAGLSMSAKPCTVGGRRFAIATPCRRKDCAYALDRCATLHQYVLLHELHHLGGTPKLVYGVRVLAWQLPTAVAFGSD